MSFSMPKIEDILSQKVQDIQSRLPVRMNVPGAQSDSSFSEALAKATSSTAAATSEASMLSPSSALSAAGGTLSAADILQSMKAGAATGTTPAWPKLNTDQLSTIMPRIEAAITKSAADNNIDPKLLRALIKQESSFQPFSLSSAGAMGLTQLMPDTARSLGVTNPYDIEANVAGGASYLRDQLTDFGEVSLALAAYNAGPNAVRKYGGIPPYAETKDYVSKVLSAYNLYRASGQ